MKAAAITQSLRDPLLRSESNDLADGRFDFDMHCLPHYLFWYLVSSMQLTITRPPIVCPGDRQRSNPLAHGLLVARPAVRRIPRRPRVAVGRRVPLFHPAATCELFVPFNKPIIIVATIRIDNGRTLWYRRARWLRVFRRIAADPRNVVAANNRFDVAYTRYFTGVRSLLLPSFCGYARRSYSPTRPGFLVGVRRHEAFTRRFMAEWDDARRRRT